MGKILLFLVFLMGSGMAFSIQNFSNQSAKTLMLGKTLVDSKSNARFLYDRDIYSDEKIKEMTLSFFPMRDFHFSRSADVPGRFETNTFSNVETKKDQLNLLMSEYKQYSISSQSERIIAKIKESEAIRCQLFNLKSQPMVLNAALSIQEKQKLLENPRSEDEINKLFLDQSLWRLTSYKRNPITHKTSLFLRNGESEIEVRCISVKFAIVDAQSFDEEAKVVPVFSNETPTLQTVIKYISDSNFGALSTRETFESKISTTFGTKYISTPIKNKLSAHSDGDDSQH